MINDKIKAVLLWAYHEKEGFFANDYDAWKNRKQQEQKTRYEID